MEKPAGISVNHDPADRQFLEKIRLLTEKHLSNEDFGVSELARLMGMSRSGLHRRLTIITGKSVSRFISGQRLEKAVELLADQTLTISEIAYRVGFGSVTYFNKCFQDQYGMSPGEVRHREIPVAEKLSVALPVSPKTDPNLWKHRKVIYSSIGVILLILLGWSLPKLFNDKPEIEKTLAVLPFADESPESGNTYILTGLRSEIMNHLGRIGDMKVVAPTASEKYDWAGKSSKEIGRDLKASYILTGHAQTINGNCRVRLQLTETATDKQIWLTPYEEEVTLQNVFSFQQEVALYVARELGATIQPSEKKKIFEEEQPRNLTSYNYYLKGFDLQKSADENDWEALKKARKLIELSVMYDSTWSMSYVVLGWNYYRRSINQIPEKQLIYMDSALMMGQKALHFNGTNVQANNLLARIYTAQGLFNEANEISKKNIRLDPTNFLPYSSLGYNCFQMHQNAEAIRNLLTAFKLHNEPLHNKNLLKTLTSSLVNVGFSELAEKYRKMHLDQENDSGTYYRSKMQEMYYSGKPKQALGIYRDKLDDTNNFYRFSTYAYYNLWDRNFSEMDRNFKLLREGAARKGIELSMNGANGFMLLHAGDTAAAYLVFEKSAKYVEELINSGYVSYVNGNGDGILAEIYSAWGKSEKALEHLRNIKKFDACPLWLVSFLRTDPMLDNLRDLPEFKALQKEFELRFEREREKARKVLRREGFDV